MAWWSWTILGLVLFAAEMITPGGFFALFFGLAAILVGFLLGLGVPMRPAFQWALFSVLAVGALALFRRPLLKLVQPPGGNDVDNIANEVATLLEDLPPGAVGKAELRGSPWSVRNDDDRPLAKGDRVKVAGMSGLTLQVRGERSSGGLS
jgi:inner membrane protein